MKLAPIDHGPPPLTEVTLTIKVPSDSTEVTLTIKVSLQIIATLIGLVASALAFF